MSSSAPVRPYEPFPPRNARNGCVGEFPRRHVCAKLRESVARGAGSPARDCGIRHAREEPMRQTAIWIDQQEARVFHVEAETFGKETIHAPNHHVHRHPKDQKTKIRSHPDDEGRFFDEVLALLVGSEELLVMGPSVTKLHFLRYAQKK